MSTLKVDIYFKQEMEKFLNLKTTSHAILIQCFVWDMGGGEFNVFGIAKSVLFLEKKKVLCRILSKHAINASCCSEDITACREPA